MANEKNLKPLNTRAKSEQREIQRKGGIARGEQRRRKKLLKELLQIELENTTDANNEAKAKEVGYKDLVVEEQPTFDEQTEWLDYEYIDGEVITQKWVVMPIEES